MIIVNTPHNPVGKVFTRKELEGIADVAKEHNLLVMSDEVVSILLTPPFLF
jgi:kynurenine aminotransferase